MTDQQRKDTAEWLFNIIDLILSGRTNENEQQTGSESSSSAD